MSEFSGGPSPQELRNNIPDINVEMLPRGAQATLHLASLDGARETAHMTVMTPRRRLLYEQGTYYSPLEVAYTRQTDPTELHLSILSRNPASSPSSRKPLERLIAVPYGNGSLKRMEARGSNVGPIQIYHEGITATSSDGQPLSPEALASPELQANESFGQIDQFYTQTHAAVRNQTDSHSVACADGTHRAIMNDDATIDIWNQRGSELVIRRVPGDMGREVHYVTEKRQRLEREGRPPLIMTISTVISNNPEYHNTRYVTYSRLLRDDQDPSDCTVEIPPQGNPQAIARLSQDQAAADAGRIDTASHTFTAAGQTVPIPEQSLEDIQTFVKLTQSKTPDATTPATSIGGRILGKLFRKRN